MCKDHESLGTREHSNERDTDNKNNTGNNSDDRRLEVEERNNKTAALTLIIS